jgi:hypothetical protein
MWIKIGVGFLASLPILYFVLTSGVFVRTFVLPRVSAAIGSELTAEEVSLSPFSSLVARGVKLTPKDGKPLAEIRELKVRYNLMSILAGKIAVDELQVDSPVIFVEDKADGTGNLNRLLAGLPKSQPTPSKAPPALAIRRVNIKGASVAFDGTDALGGRTRVNLTALDVGLDQLVTGEVGRLTVSSSSRLEVTGRSDSGVLSGTLLGDTQVTLGADLLPNLVNGGIRVDLREGSGGFKPYVGFSAVVEVDITKEDLRNLSLRFVLAGQDVGRIAFKGPIDMMRYEARLSYDVRGIDRRVLAVLGAASGFDAGQTKIAASGRLDLSANGTAASSGGKLTVSQFSLGIPTGRTPEVDVTLEYRTSANFRDRSVLVELLDVTGRQQGNQILKAGLDRAMNLSWDKSTKAFRDSTLTVKAGTIELAEWRALLGSNAPSGKVTLDAQVKSEDSGKILKVDFSLLARDVNANIGANPIRGGDGKLVVSGKLTGFSDLVIESYEAEVKAGGQKLVQVTGLADYQSGKGQGGFQMSLDARIPALLALIPVPGVSIEQGDVQVSATVSKKLAGTTMESTVSLSRLTGVVQGVRLKEYQATTMGTVILRGTEVEVPRLTFSAQSGYDAGGSLDARLKYNTLRKSGSIDFKTVAINQSALGPFLNAALAPIRLVSVTVDVEGRSEFALEGRSVGKLKALVSDLRLDDPSGRLPKGSMGIGVEVDGSHEGLVSEFKKLVIDLGGTTRATNRLEIAGLVDLSTNAPKPSLVTIRSPGLDLTPWYDLFAGITNAPAPAAARPVSSGDPSREPEAVRLPVRDFTADVDIAGVFLRQINVKELKGKLTAKNDTVALEDFGFLLNGAPVTTAARVNLGRPGFEYDLHFKGEAMPLNPVVNSFIPVMTGLAQGTLLARVDVRGAGLTGAGLQKSLSGKIAVEATNSVIRIPDRPIPLPVLLTKIIPILPQQVNPTSLLRMIGKSAVLEEPIRVVEFHTDIGNGVVNVMNTHVLSPAFSVTLGGDVRLAPVLDDSPVNLPVALAFASNGKLPEPRTIGRVTGTLGKTGFTADPLGMAAIVGSAIPVVGQLGGKGVEAIKSAGAELDKRAGAAIGKAGAALGNLVGGDTNKPGSGLGGILKAVVQPSTNNASTNGPARPGLLDALPFGKGKK